MEFRPLTMLQTGKTWSQNASADAQDCPRTLLATTAADFEGGRLLHCCLASIRPVVCAGMRWNVVYLVWLPLPGTRLSLDVAGL